MATSVTLELLKRYLERFGWSKYEATEEPLEKEGVILTGWRSSPEADGYQMVIDPIVEKGCLAFRVPMLLKAPLDTTPRERLYDLLLVMSFHNYGMLLGKYGYDPRDGEVRFSLVVPIDESGFTYEQFQHCVGVAVSMVEKHAPELKAILAGTKTAQQVLDEQVPGGRTFVEHLEQLLGELKRLLGRETQGRDQEPLDEV